MSTHSSLVPTDSDVSYLNSKEEVITWGSRRDCSAYHNDSCSGTLNQPVVFKRHRACLHLWCLVYLCLLCIFMSRQQFVSRSTEATVPVHSLFSILIWIWACTVNLKVKFSFPTLCAVEKPTNTPLKPSALRICNWILILNFSIKHFHTIIKPLVYARK